MLSQPLGTVVVAPDFTSINWRSALIAFPMVFAHLSCGCDNICRHIDGIRYHLGKDEICLGIWPPWPFVGNFVGRFCGSRCVLARVTSLVLSVGDYLFCLRGV